MRITGQFRYMHKDPERVYKLNRVSESLCAQDSAIQKPDQNRNNMSHSLYNHPYVLNHIQLVNWTFHNYEVNIFKVLAMIYHQFHVET